MLQDIRFAFRSAVRNPALTAVIVTSLALGIGANTTIFTLINAVFLRPIPVEKPGELVAAFTTMPKSTAFQSFAFLNFKDFRDNVQEFSGMAAYQFVGANMVGGAEPIGLGGQLVTANYFSVLGVQAARGRTFFADEDKVDSAAPVMVISNGLWTRTFGGDPSIVGRYVTLNGSKFEIIGVTPPEFKGLQSIGGGSEFWVPISMHPQLNPANPLFYTVRNALSVQVVARLRPGVSMAQADQAMKMMADRLAKQYPNENADRSTALFPLSEAVLGIGQRDDLRRSGGLLLGATGLVLLIACANVASLLLARAMARRKEIAVRLSVGAPRWRLIRQLLAESAVLSLLGGAAGMLVAYWGRDLLWAMRPSWMDSRFLDLKLEPRVLAFTIALTFLTGWLFGLIPAIQGSRADLVSAIKGQFDAPDRRSRFTQLAMGLDLRSILVSGQVALSLVALIGAGLFLRSVQQAQRLSPGFRVEGLTVMFMNTAAQGYSPQRATEFYKQAIERVQALPGVQSATWGENVPQAGNAGVSRRVFPEGKELPAELRSLFVPFNDVFPRYFSTVGIPLVKGRDFSAADREGAEQVAIISETTARMFWPGEDPVGRRFKHRLNPNFFRVVGIAADAKFGTLGGAAVPHVYLSATQFYAPAMTLCVRTSGDPAPLFPAFRQTIRGLDSTMPLPQPQTMTSAIADNLWTARLGAELLAVFGVLAVALTVVGIYGVMAYTVTRRTKEIGIRIALGAEQTAVLQLVLRQGLKLTALGVAVGLAASYGATRLIASLLYVSPADPATYAAISVTLAVVSVIAGFLPARRATRVDPLTALRYE